jgi:hypothetical protein
MVPSEIDVVLSKDCDISKGKKKKSGGWQKRKGRRRMIHQSAGNEAQRGMFVRAEIPTQKVNFFFFSEDLK